MPDTMRKPYLVTVVAAAGLGLLLVASSAGLGASPLLHGDAMGNVVVITPVAATILALVAWHVTPSRSWAWLLLVGALCALPEPVLQLAPDLLPGEEWMEEVLAVSLAGPPVAVVGLLGAATHVWRSGQRAVASGLVGGALVIQLVEPMVSATIRSADRVSSGGYEQEILPNLTLGLAGLAVVAAVVGIAAARPPRLDPPALRVTAGAALASLAPLLLLGWESIRTALNARDGGDELLYLGLVFLAVGVVAGAVAGGAALLGAVCAGLLLGVFGVLVVDVMTVQRDLPLVAIVLTLGAVALGFAAAMSRLRLRFGVGGLLVVAAGLTVLFVLFNGDSPEGTTDAASVVIEPVLILAAGVGMGAAVATVGAELADRAATPAVLVGLTTPFAFGTMTVVMHVVVRGMVGNGSRGEMSETPLLVVVAGLCVAVIALLGISGAFGRRPGREPEPDVSPATPVGEPGPGGTRT